MVHQMLSAKHDFGRTFMVAMWLLGLVAAAQVVAVGWAVVTRPNQALSSDAGMAAGAVVAPVPPVAPVGVPLIEGAGGDMAGGGAGAGTGLPGAEVLAAGAAAVAPPGTGGGILPGPSPFPARAEIEGAAEIENPVHQITHPVAKRMMALAMEYRASGNMQAALRSLRDANTLSPNHPRILSELASTYTQMGLDDKAAEYWRSVFVLGPERGGAFYDLADMALKGNRIEDSASVDSVISLGQIETSRDDRAEGGEKVALRIPILARPGATPDAEEMAVLIYFYDSVNGQDFVPTTADTRENFPTPPYDWRDGGVEVIEETYFQPTFTEAQKRELGDRSYYGYIIELYYRDELQDIVAEPKSLMGLKPGEPAAGQLPDDSEDTGGVPSGPGGELFPRG